MHRFHAGFLDYAKHAGFMPRLCQPYRARTKGKVERFVGYLKGSFWVPFVASMRQLGLAADKHASNAAVSRWLREVANARVHATTGEVPVARLLIERTRLQRLPAAYGGDHFRKFRSRRTVEQDRYRVCAESYTAARVGNRVYSPLYRCTVRLPREAGVRTQELGRSE